MTATNKDIGDSSVPENSNSSANDDSIVSELENIQRKFSDALKSNNVAAMASAATEVSNLKERLVSGESASELRASLDATLLEFHSIVSSFTSSHQTTASSRDVFTLETMTLDDEDEDVNETPSTQDNELNRVFSRANKLFGVDSLETVDFDAFDVLACDDSAFNMEEEEETDETEPPVSNQNEEPAEQTESTRRFDELLQSISSIRARSAETAELQRRNSEDWTRKQQDIKSLKAILRSDVDPEGRLSGFERLQRVQKMEHVLFDQERGAGFSQPANDENNESSSIGWNESVEAGKAFALAHYGEELREQEGEIQRLRQELANLKQKQASAVDDVTADSQQVFDCSISNESRRIQEATSALKSIGVEISEIQMEFGAALSSNDPNSITRIVERCEAFKESCSSLFAQLSQQIRNSDFNEASMSLMENINSTLAAFQDITSSRNKAQISLETQTEINNSDVIETQSAVSSGADSAYDGILSTQSRKGHTTTSHVMMSPADLMKTLSRADQAFGITSDDGIDEASNSSRAPQETSAASLLAQHESRIEEMSTILGMACNGLATETERQRQIMIDLYELREKSTNEQNSRRLQIEAFEAQQKKLISLKEQLGELKKAEIAADGGEGTSQEQRGVAADRVLKLRQMKEAFKKLVDGEGEEEEENDCNDQDDEIDEGDRDQGDHAAKLAALSAYQSELQGQEDEIAVLRRQLVELRQAKELLDDKKKMLASVLQTGERSYDSRRSMSRDHGQLFQTDAVNESEDVDGETVEEDAELVALEENLESIRRYQESMKAEASIRGGYGASGFVTTGSNKGARSVQFSSTVEQIQDAPQGSEQKDATSETEPDGVDTSVDQLLSKLLENSVRERVEAHLNSTTACPSTTNTSVSRSSRVYDMRNDTQLLVDAFETHTGSSLNQEEKEYLRRSLEKKDSQLNETMRSIWDGDMDGYEDIEVETFGETCSSHQQCGHKEDVTQSQSSKSLNTSNIRTTGRYGCESESSSVELTPAEMSPIRPSQMEIDSEKIDAANMLNVDEAQVEEAASKVEDGIAQILRHISDLKNTDVDFSKPEHIRAYTELFGSLSGQLEQFMEARKTIQQFKQVLEKQKQPLSGRSSTDNLESESFSFMPRPRPLSQASQEITSRSERVLQPQPTKRISEDFDSIDNIMYSNSSSRGYAKEGTRQSQERFDDDQEKSNDISEMDEESEGAEEEEEDEEEERTLDAKGVYRLTKSGSGVTGSSGYSWVEAAKVDEVEVEDLKRANDIVRARSRPNRLSESQSTESKNVMDSYSKKLYNQVKDSIYRGAANTISKYEHEPYFLVSTFKGLQKLDTPYLRQKFLLLLDSVLEERDQIQNEEPDPELAGETGDADSFDEDNEYLENKLADDSMEPLGNSVSQWEASSPARISGRNQRAYFHDVESDENVGYGDRIANCITSLVNESHPSSRFTESQIGNLQNFLTSLIHAELYSNTSIGSGKERNSSAPNDECFEDSVDDVRATLSEFAIAKLMEDMTAMLDERLNRYIGLHIHRVRRALVNESLDCVSDALQEARLAVEAGWAKRVAEQEESNFLRRRVIRDRLATTENVLQHENVQRYSSRSSDAVKPSNSSLRSGELQGYTETSKKAVQNENQRQSVESMLRYVASGDESYGEPIVIQRARNEIRCDESVSPASTIRAESFNSVRQRSRGVVQKDASERLNEAFESAAPRREWGGLLSSRKSGSAATLVNRTSFNS